MATVKLIKFVAVAILASSSAAEPTNRTCAGQDQDDMVALQVGEQSHAGACHCGKVCPGYNAPGGGAVHFSCSDAKESYLASNPGVDQEALSQTECRFIDGRNPKRSILWGNTKCWSASGSALTVRFKLLHCNEKTRSSCPAGFKRGDRNCSPKSFKEGNCRSSCPAGYYYIDYAASMNVVCPNGWCACRLGGCGCKAEGSCR
ncbi:unnamed protein product [Polarella glacialis]|uniref:Uncharacterized protein n=1 Tax=Polarella glacialis TaxID=89957 RepID=A0A813KE42_POLGL|nr:unnamed protein product [Polarella glacialis]